MSNKLIKESSLILPGDNVIAVDIKFTKSGKCTVIAPNVHPMMLSRLLTGLATQILDDFISNNMQEPQNKNESEKISNHIGNV
jgi:hypothetical protein